MKSGSSVPYIQPFPNVVPISITDNEGKVIPKVLQRNPVINLATQALKAL